MPENEEQKNDLYESHRWKLHDQAVRSVFLLNGGAAVALLAFLQAIWKLDKEMARFVVYGLGPVTLGLVLAALSNYIRYQASEAWDSEHHSRSTWLFLSYLIQFSSLGAFVLGVVILMIGALRVL